MKKYVCAVCGWTTEAEVQPAECPICKAKKFTEHEIGGELVGVLQDEVFSGANIMTDLSEIIKNELDLDNEGYLEMLKSVDYVTSTLTVDGTCLIKAIRASLHLILCSEF